MRRALPWVAAGCLWWLPIAGLPAAGQDPGIDRAREILERESPESLARLLVDEPAAAGAVLAALADAVTAEGPLGEEAGALLGEVVRDRAADLAAAGPPWSRGQLDALLALALLDLDRLTTDETFRRRVAEISGESLAAVASPDFRDELLRRLNRLARVDFPTSEAVEVAWGAAARASLDRQAPGAGPLRFPADGEGTILASVYSLPAAFFPPGEVERFLAAVSRAAPGRRLIALAGDPRVGDLPAGDARAAPLGEETPTVRLDTFGRRYSPWPRDPFRFAWEPPGGLRVVMRPNLQRGREEDASLGLELIQNLPPDLDEAWGRPHWRRASVPFHNGQVLVTERTVWVTLHALEPRILELLKLDRVPVTSFATAEGIDRYLAAARRATLELGELLDRPVAYVHPLPTVGTLAERTSLMRLLGGGAGFDLDSVLTLLPLPDGRLMALVGDLSAGVELLPELPIADWEAFRQGFDLAPSADDLQVYLARAQSLPRARGLDMFLDRIAEHLDSRELLVGRLPLFLLPTALLRDRGGVGHDDFLLTWSNVVLDRRGDGMHAEGFGSLLAGADLRAVQIFALGGYRLDLFPPLVRSVVLNGGYRCASNHVRSVE